MPIKDASGDVVGVAQVINKLGGEQCFTVNDEKVSKSKNISTLIECRLWLFLSTAFNENIFTTIKLN